MSRALAFRGLVVAITAAVFVTSGSAQGPPTEEDVAHPSVFMLELGRPRGWVAAPAEEIPHRLGGTFLAGWIRTTKHGKACIYVVGLRREGQYMLAQVASSVEQLFANMGLEPTIDLDVTVLGRPGLMVSLAGEGGGLYLNAMAGGTAKGGTPTFMRAVVLSNAWARPREGTDFIQFVAVGPVRARDECLSALALLLDDSRLTGGYGGSGRRGAPTRPADSIPSTRQPTTAPATTIGPGVLADRSSLNLSLGTPRGWSAAGAADIGGRLPGTYLGGYVRDTQHGSACLYALGLRYEGRRSPDDIAEILEGELLATGLEATLARNLTVLGLPAFMIILHGEGTGAAINEMLAERTGGQIPTFTRAVVLENPWHPPEAGTDFIQFVLTAPERASGECLAAWREMIDGSEITGRHVPSTGATTVAPRPTPLAEGPEEATAIGEQPDSVPKFGELAVASGKQDAPVAAHPSTFGLQLTRPRGWLSAAYTDIPGRLSGTFLAGWTQRTPHGAACIYVSAVRTKRQGSLSQAAQSVEGRFHAMGLEPRVETGLTALGRPAFAISLGCTGTGSAINGMLREAERGEVPTFMRLVGLLNPREASESGADLIQFVMASPKESAQDCLGALNEVLQAASVTTTRIATRPPAPPADKPPTPSSEPQPASTKPVPSATPAKPVVFGSLYRLLDGSLESRPVWALRASAEADVEQWVIPSDAYSQSNALLLLLSADANDFWVMSGGEVQALGQQTEGGTRLTRSSALDKFRQDWRGLIEWKR